MDKDSNRKDSQSAPRKRPAKHGTAITFTGEELSSLAELVAAGQVMLRRSDTPRAVVLLKAAMTRLRVPIPKGL